MRPPVAAVLGSAGNNFCAACTNGTELMAFSPKAVTAPVPGVRSSIWLTSSHARTSPTVPVAPRNFFVNASFVMNAVIATGVSIRIFSFVVGGETSNIGTLPTTARRDSSDNCCSLSWDNSISPSGGIPNAVFSSCIFDKSSMSWRNKPRLLLL